MTKAKQKEKALWKIESRINNMMYALDIPCLEMYDAATCAEIRLVWQLEIISKEERENLEVEEMETYFTRKRQLESNELENIA